VRNKLVGKGGKSGRKEKLKEIKQAPREQGRRDRGKETIKILFMAGVFPRYFINGPPQLEEVTNRGVTEASP